MFLKPVPLTPSTLGKRADDERGVAGLIDRVTGSAVGPQLQGARKRAGAPARKDRCSKKSFELSAQRRPPAGVPLMEPMEKPSILLKAAFLRDKAGRALRLAAGLQDADRTRLTKFADELQSQAAELERQAVAETRGRPADPPRDASKDERKPTKGRGGPNDLER